MIKPVDPGDNSYPNATDVAKCLLNCKEDLITEAEFVLWLNFRIKELERDLYISQASSSLLARIAEEKNEG